MKTLIAEWGISAVRTNAQRALKEATIVRILFVCHGNICRSPMAEFVLKDMVSSRGIAEQFHIESVATSNEEIGNPVHWGTRAKLAEAGIACDGKTARQIRKGEYPSFDFFIGMDETNVRNLRRLFCGDPQGKVFKLLEFADSSSDIADPWYTGDFEETYNDVVDGCTGLLNYLGVS